MTQKQHDISITSEITYVPEQSSPELSRYVFAYTITITNLGLIAATLLRRHWIITDANSKVQEVKGDGVIGLQPLIMPGESHQYSSATVIETPVGCMQGSYEMQADDGIEFEANIPVFNLSMPNALH
ncbi:MAG TPA: Co2+/Mg2+ efflux protein ApaG [Thiotrichaceae bacterium]|jgi:ApaG protein|nr:Co2+/Mg2+ efflux protein ApaG [Thiotrichaceae bacterium]HIM07271.1 Co2+/Mg2+ efflux protein ApaG [Gammaproteobacteria bacterium]